MHMRVLQCSYKEVAGLQLSTYSVLSNVILYPCTGASKRLDHCRCLIYIQSPGFCKFLYSLQSFFNLGIYLHT